MWEKEGGFSAQTWVKVEPYKYKPIIDSFQALASSPASTADLDSMSGPVKAQGRDKPDYTLVNSLLNLSKSEVNIKLLNFFFFFQLFWNYFVFSSLIPLSIRKTWMNNYIVLVKRHKFLVYKFLIKLYTNSSVLCSVLIFFS